MLSPSTMLSLAENYQNGIIVVSVVVCVMYVAVSLLVLFRVRKAGYDYCQQCFIPVVNLTIPVRVALKRRKKRKQKEIALMKAKEAEKESEELDENEVIEL